jgi:hypothetical protein
MPFSESLAARVRDLLRERRDVTEKRMFGGLALLTNGRLFAGVWGQSLIVRVGPERYEYARSQPDTSEFDITGRPMRGWVLVGPEAIDLDADLHRWLGEGLAFAQTLPPKETDAAKAKPRKKSRPTKRRPG